MGVRRPNALDAALHRSSISRSTEPMNYPRYLKYCTRSSVASAATRTSAAPAAGSRARSFCRIYYAIRVFSSHDDLTLPVFVQYSANPPLTRLPVTPNNMATTEAQLNNLMFPELHAFLNMQPTQHLFPSLHFNFDIDLLALAFHHMEESRSAEMQI